MTIAPHADRPGSPGPAAPGPRVRQVRRSEVRSGREVTRQHVGLAAAMLLATALGIWRLRQSSLSYDASFAVGLAEMPWRSALGVMVAREPGTLPFDLLLRPWIAVFGDGPGAVRLLSLTITVATVPLVYRLGHVLFGRRAGALPALLFACNVGIVQNGRAGDGGALVSLLACASVLLLLRAVESTRTSDRVWFVVLAATAGYGQIYTLPAIAVALAVLARARPESRALLRRLAAVLGLALVPLALFLLAGRAAFSGWISAASGQHYLVSRSVELLTGADSRWSSLLITVGLIVAVLAWLRRSALDERPPLSTAQAIVLAWAVVPLLCGLAVTACTPALAPQFMAPSVPAVALALGSALLGVPGRVWGVLLGIGCVVVALSSSLLTPDVRAAQDWRGVAVLLRAHAGPRDGVVVQPAFDDVPFTYAVTQLPAGTALPVPLLGTGSWRVGDSITDQTLCLSRRPGSTVWVVSTDDAAGSSGLAQIRSELGARVSGPTFAVRGLNLSSLSVPGPTGDAGAGCGS